MRTPLVLASALMIVAASAAPALAGGHRQEQQPRLQAELGSAWQHGTSTETGQSDGGGSPDGSDTGNGFGDPGTCDPTQAQHGYGGGAVAESHCGEPLAWQHDGDVLGELGAAGLDTARLWASIRSRLGAV